MESGGRATGTMAPENAVLLLRHLPVAVVVLDGYAQRVSFANDAFASLCGAEPAELIGRTGVSILPMLAEAGRLQAADMAWRDGRVVHHPGPPPALGDADPPGVWNWAFTPIDADGEERGPRVLVTAAGATEAAHAGLGTAGAAAWAVLHRARNSLQTAVSLLRLQSARTGDAHLRGLFEQACRRIAVIADVNGRLSSVPPFDQVDFADSLRRICERVAGAFPSLAARVVLEIKAKPAMLHVDRAVPLGLAVGEIVANAYMHAFADGRAGYLRVFFATDRTNHRLVLSDDGPGVPDGEETGKEGLGMLLVASLVEQAGAFLETSNDGGAVFVITIPA
ncbi:MAG TPA: histidine kinase dimerization/phosphoacceptor domain -containing protein [Arenibaculum sp.]|nr:histidine kinase dimerization/phosphoacceptor domain -containing protein [Arenibaculum sp.]